MVDDIQAWDICLSYYFAFSIKSSECTKYQTTIILEYFKVLSSEMDPAEIRFIWYVFIKERDAEIFRKIRPSSLLLELFKDSAPSRTAVGN